MRDSDRRFLARAVAGALALRLLLMWARGAYVAFDEGYYLLLGENLWSGRGFTLTGRVHATFSPLYPLVAGGVSKLLGSPVWAGRLVSAVASALLLLPAYAIFRRAGGRTVARPATALLAVVPSLIAFVPYWAGRELYQGSEPLYHLLLFGGIALAVEAAFRKRWLVPAAGAGIAFALAYLTRPEAVPVAGLAILAAGAVRAWRSRRFASAVGVAAVAGTVALGGSAPYLLHLRTTLGEWTLSGRGVRWTVPSTEGGAGSGAGAAAGEEPLDVHTSLLWRGDQVRYIYDNYTLDASGTVVRSGYWGVHPVEPEPGPPGWQRLPPPEQAVRPPPADPGEFTRRRLYLRTLGIVLPVPLWPLAILGLFWPRRSLRRRLAEGVAFLPLWATSIAIAAGIYVDPRNHLILAPVLAFWTGAALAGIAGVVGERLEGLRKAFVLRAATATVAAILLLVVLRPAYLARAVGSPHHLVAEENRTVGRTVGERTGPGEAVMSWHPAIALYAGRDWRVLPYEPLPQVVRYGAAREIPVMVLSAYYPTPLEIDDLPERYLVLRLPEEEELGSRWRIEWGPEGEEALFGRLVPEG